MSLRSSRTRTLTALAAFGLTCALGVAGGSREAAGAPAKQSRDARAAGFSNSNEACGCKVPERYRFKAGGTTEYRDGGTETWSMRGVLKRHRKGVPFLRVEYWQARGSVTLTFRNIYFEHVQECAIASGGSSGDGTFNAGTQTLPLKRNGYDVAAGFRLTGDREYYFFTGHPRGAKPAAGGRLVCDETNHTIPWAMQHLSFGDWLGHGKPRRVVKGSYDFVDFELFHFKGHYRLTAMRPRG